MLSTTVLPTTDNRTSYSTWLDYFGGRAHATAADLEACRATLGTRYPEMVLGLARQEKLRPKVLADATYNAWLASENPKKAMPASDWADLFRLAYMPTHECFEILEPQYSAASVS